MSKKVLIAVGIVAGIALSAGALWLGRAGTKSDSSSLVGESPAAASEQPAAVSVDTVRVGHEDLQRIADSTPGNILAFETTSLYAKISGFLIDIQNDIGDPVAKDEVLPRISI